MPQSSLVVENISRPLALAQINQAIIALATKSSGPAAPLTTYPLMEWADTATNTLKIRNLANTAWLTLGTLDKANLGLALRAKSTSLEHSWQGNGALNTKAFAFPTNTKVIEFDIRGKDLSPLTAAGFMTTITTGQTAADNTGNMFIFQNGTQLSAGNSVPAGLTAPKEMLLHDFDGQLETVAIRGTIAIAPNGRVVTQQDVFRIGTPFNSSTVAQAVKRMSWTVPSTTQTLANLTINAYRYSDGVRVPFPTGFNIRLYSKGQ